MDASIEKGADRIDEGCRRRFEADWRSDQVGSLEEYLPDRNTPTYLPTLEELVHIELELAHKPGSGSNHTVCRVEGYLERFPTLGADEDRILRLLEQEYLVRHRYGDRPDVEEYKERFPDLVRTGEEVRRALISDVGLPTSDPAAPTLAIPVRIELQDESEVPTRSPQPEGRQFMGRYLVEAEIGRGGMGVVYQAFDRDLRRRVAMKLLQREFLAHQEVVDRFVEEAQATAQLQHPGIVPVYEMGLDTHKRLFFTMKLVRGRTLAEVIDAVRAGDLETVREFSRIRLLQIFVEVTRTVAYAHRRGLVHRDLKPQNLMIGSYGEVQVMDWGLAKILTRGRGPSVAIAPSERVETSTTRHRTELGAVMGTPAYMAPEQADNALGPVGRAADIYALGAILYHLLTGRPPFVGSTTEDVLEKLLHHPPTPPRQVEWEVPRALEAICLKALHKDIAGRYRSALALGEEVQAFIENKPVTAYQEPATERMLRVARRYQKVMITIGVALVLMLVGAGLFIVRLDEQFQDAQKARAAEEAMRKRAELKEQEALLARGREERARILAEDREQLATAGLLAATGNPLESARILRDIVGRADPSLVPQAEQMLQGLADTLDRGFKLDLLRAGQLLHAGRLTEALQAVEAARGWQPETYRPDFYRAWMLARQGQTAAALEALGQALKRAGPSEAEELVGCRDFDALRQDPRFLEVVGQTLGEEWVARAGKPWRIGWDGQALPEGLSRGPRGVYWWDTGQGRLVEMVYVPPGGFIMGNDSDEADLDERPEHTHMITNGYYIGRFETTWADYRAFCLATGRNLPDTRGRTPQDVHPVVGISWYEATSWCRWAHLSLPTEAEWERAARGTDGRRYPWGNEGPSPERCIWDGHPHFGNVFTAPIGSAPEGVSPVGAHDMAGNALEWCQDTYEVKAYQRYNQGDFTPPRSGPERVRRGGSWGTTAGWCRASYRGRKGASDRSYQLGFRPVLRP